MSLKKTVHDISLTMKNGMVNWPGERHEYHHAYVKSFEKGDNFSVSRIDCSLHCGTHVDAPYHKIKNGKKLEEYPIDRFMGEVFVADLSTIEHGVISAKDIDPINLLDCSICFLKTINSKLLEKSTFDPDFIYLDDDAAVALVDKGIKAVGIDCLGIDPFFSDKSSVHKIFFSSDILIYEGLNLKNIYEGKYYFFGLPLSIQNAEGSPVRAILFESDQ